MSLWEIVAASIVGIVSVARLTRLLTQDTYPPVAALRARWETWTYAPGHPRRHGWADLATCPYCAAPYLTAIIGAWGWLTHFQTAWWVVNIWLAASYFAAMVVVRDGE